MLVDELVIITTWLTREVGLSGAREASVIIPRQIANAHTVFNLINTVLFIGLASPLVVLTVEEQLVSVMDALEQMDTEKARRVRRTKSRLRLELDGLRSHLLAQLMASSGDRVRILGLESDVVEVAKRLNDQIRLMAKLILDSERARQG